MNTLSLNKLGAICLIAGPLVAWVFFILQPGGLLIDPAELSDAKGWVAATTSNSGWTEFTSIIVAFGLMIMVFGFYTVQSSVRGSGACDVLTRAGFSMMLLGTAGWVFAQGLNLVIADAPTLGAMEAAETIYMVKVGIQLISGLAVSAGFVLFGLGMAYKEGANKIAPLVIAAVSLVAVICYAIGIGGSGQLDFMMRISRGIYIFWVVWAVMLGVGMLRSGGGASAR